MIRNVLAIISLTVFFSYSESVFNAIDNDYCNGIISLQQKMTYFGYSLIYPDSLPQKYKSQRMNDSFLNISSFVDEYNHYLDSTMPLSQEEQSLGDCIFDNPDNSGSCYATGSSQYMCCQPDNVPF